jgi:hypothetical protein
MKNRKLTCIISGKVLNASADYYSKKLEKADSEESLHATYICKEARDLLEQGFTVVQIRKQFETPDAFPLPDACIIDGLFRNEYGIKKDTVFSAVSSLTINNTDPEVKDFLNKIL